MADRFIALAQERLLELTSGVRVAAKAPVKSGPEARMIELKKALGTANHNIQSNITLTKRASATILRLSGESGEIATLRVKVIDLGAEGKETKEALASLAALRTQLSEAKLLLEGDAKKRTLSLADKLVALQKIKAKVLDEITATAKQLNPEQLGGMFTNQELKKLFTPEELAQTFTGDILSQIPTAPSKAAPLAPAPASSIVHAAAPSQSRAVAPQVAAPIIHGILPPPPPPAPPAPSAPAAISRPNAMAGTAALFAAINARRGNDE